MAKTIKAGMNGKQMRAIAKDALMDKKKNIKEGSRQDVALDSKLGQKKATKSKQASLVYKKK